MSYIDKLALILVRGRRQLVARSRGKQVFFTPGGKRELGESDEQALRRECKEELTVDLVNIQPYGVFEAQAFGKPAGTSVRMTCYTADDEGTLQPSEEVEELLWIQSDFARDKLTVTGLMILDDLKQKNLID
jgi:8-oxo-dGTP pyrophosphatase MutT (NUDIX family)